jgi:small subunit ribosomal protein S18
MDSVQSQNENRPRPRGRFFGFRRRVCEFCVSKAEEIDYKNVDLLKGYVTERGKILGRRKSGACARHQRMLAAAIKRARFLAMLPYVSSYVRMGQSQ